MKEDLFNGLVVREDARGSLKEIKEVKLLLCVIEPDALLKKFKLSPDVLQYVLAIKAVQSSFL